MQAKERAREEGRGGAREPESPESSQEEGREPRRSFFTKAWVGWSLFCSTVILGMGACLRFLFPDDPEGSEDRFRIGRPGQYGPGVDGRWKESRKIWVVRESRRLYVLSAICTHLGCPVDWNRSEGRFKCPCHGSGFRADGIHFEGPAPRPLERFKVSLTVEGDMEVDLSRKYQEELGQWKDPDSFLDLPREGEA